MAKDNNKNALWILAIVAGIAFVLFSGMMPWDNNATITDDVNNLEICGIEDVAFTPNMVRLGKAGENLNSATNYFIITDALGDYAGTAQATLSTSYSMDVLFGEDSTEFYTVYETGLNTDCKDPFNIRVDLPKADQDIGVYTKNSDGSVNSASNKQAMGADETIDLTVTMKASSNEYFGNPGATCDNLVVVEYDKTYIQKLDGPASADKPDAFSHFNTTFDGSKTFVVPKVADGAEATFNIEITSTSTEPESTTVPLKLTFYDCDIDKNEDDLSVISGVQDEDGNLISLAAQTFDVFVE